ncbi:MAG: IclR family transcriptional regulator [Paenibacillus sp.]|nr:IclR family transcriptional regulator [Paenibacillus sp.]
MEKDNKSPYFVVQTLDRAISIMDLFIRERKPLGITEVAAELNIHNSIVHRLMATMELRGLLEKVAESGKYYVGARAFEFGAIYMNNRFVTEGKRLLPELAEKVGGSSHMAVLNQGMVLYLVNQEAPQSMLLNAPIGVRNPVNVTALGKALVAWLEPAYVAELLRANGMAVRTPHSIQSVDTFLEHLAGVREKGYSVDDEELVLGFRCVAAPVRDHSNEVVAAISVGGTSRTITPEHLEATADLVKSYAAAISERLGYVNRRFG